MTTQPGQERRREYLAETGKPPDPPIVPRRRTLREAFARWDRLMAQEAARCAVRRSTQLKIKKEKA